MQGGNNQLHLLNSPKIITIQDDNPHDSKDSSEDPRGDIRDDYTLINISMNIDLNLESQVSPKKHSSGKMNRIGNMQGCNINASERIGKMRGCNINANIEVSPKKHSSGKMNRKKKGGPRHHRPAHP